MTAPAETREFRARVLVVIALAVFAILVGRLFILQGLQGSELRERSKSTRIRPEILAAPRGQILDRQGRVLAGNRPAFSLTFDPLHPAYWDRRNGSNGRDGRRRRTLNTLSDILEIPVEDLEDRLDHRPGGPVPLTLARNLTFTQRSRLWERRELLPGVNVVSHPLRFYPNDSLASHVLGYLGEVKREELEGEPDVYHNGSLVGRAGLEKQYERLLRSRDGKTYVEVDALGRKRDLYEGLPQEVPRKGEDLVTSLDLDLQRTAEATFDSLVPRLREGDPEEAKPPAGSVIVMDCRSGEILALVSRPAFGPGQFARGLTSEAWDRIRSGLHPLLNRAIQSRYPPGSVFKTATAILALKGGLANRETALSACYGSYRLGNRTFRCWKRGGHGQLDFIQGFAQSCDVYYYQLGRSLGFQRLTEGSRSLGMDALTGIDLPQEGKGWIPESDDYVRMYGYPPGPGVPLNLCIGQGELLFTPIELAVFYAAVANGGDVVVPRIALESLGGHDGGAARTQSGEPEVRRRLPASDATLALIRESLEETVMGQRGTARRARVEGFRIGGKTGTAQNPHGEDHALFVAVAPMDDPRYVVVVVAEESGHGGAVAVPIAQHILRHLLTGSPMPKLAERTPAGVLLR